jgi:hypothetical protein
MAEAEKLQYHYVVDNDPNLQYIRKLGSGGFGSVHEIFDILGQKVPAGQLMKLTAVIGKKSTTYALDREADSGTGGQGNQETMRTGSPSKYRPGCRSRTPLEL